MRQREYKRIAKIKMIFERFFDLTHTKMECVKKQVFKLMIIGIS